MYTVESVPNGTIILYSFILNIYLLMWILIIYYIAHIIDIEAKARKGYHSSRKINIYVSKIQCHVEFLSECGIGEVNMGSNLVWSFKPNCNLYICNGQQKGARPLNRYFSGVLGPWRSVTLELGAWILPFSNSDKNVNSRFLMPNWVLEPYSYVFRNPWSP